MLAAADDGSQRIGRDHLGGAVVRGRPRRLARAGGADEHDERRVGEGHGADSPSAQCERRREGPPSEAQTVRPWGSSMTPHSCASERTMRSPRPPGAHMVGGAGRGAVGPPPSETSTSTTLFLTFQWMRIAPSERGFAWRMALATRLTDDDLGLVDDLRRDLAGHEVLDEPLRIRGAADGAHWMRTVRFSPSGTAGTLLMDLLAIALARRASTVMWDAEPLPCVLATSVLLTGDSHAPVVER